MELSQSTKMNSAWYDFVETFNTLRWSFFSTLGICTVIGFVFVEYEDFGEEILSVQKSWKNDYC